MQKNMNIIGIIPGRMGSSRFPGKPLAKIAGIPMIGHVYYRCKMSSTLKDVYVATCDTEIEDYIREINGKAIMTKDTHERASDRVAEALSKIEEMQGQKVDIVVMIQGDEPMVTPAMIDRAVEALLNDESVLVSNLMQKIESIEDQEDVNEIKVVVDKNNFALYFSRAPIPFNKRSGASLPMNKQVCIIPFKRDFLYKFNDLEPTPLEDVESVDMMRVLEHGFKVKMVPISEITYSVDTPKDLEEVSQHMAEDTLFQKYGTKEISQ